VRRKLGEIARSQGLELDRVIVFGSRASGGYTAESDIDILLVSDAFEGVAWYRRPAPFYRHWDYGSLPEPEIICLTRDEFERRRRMDPHIVREAVETGIAVG
jgi:predicted nucleotidyltransferase